MDSYKSLHFAIISILWTAAILFALVQNGFLSEVAIRTVTFNSGVHIGRISGGIFGVLRLENVRYKDIVSAKSINIKLNVFELLDRNIEMDLLDIDSLKFDEHKLAKELNSTSNSKGDELFNSVHIGRINITFLEHNLSSLLIKKADVKINDFSYVFKRVIFDYTADIKTNIVDIECEGLFKDMNYTAGGTLKASGDQLINKLADDVDFDFNALKETEFMLKGDDKSIWMGANIKNSGIFYKYGVDAKIQDIQSQLFYDLKKKTFKVASRGLVDTRYGQVDSSFDVTYDNGIRYRGSGSVRKFGVIPLGHFKKYVKVLSSENKSVSFSGDTDSVSVNAVGTRGKVLLGDTDVDITDSNTTAEYNFRKKLLKVGVDASAVTKYCNLDINTVVVEDDKNSTTFHGYVVTRNSKDSILTSELINSLKGSFNGDENRLSVKIAGAKTEVVVRTDDYNVYKAKASIGRTKINNFFTYPKLHTDSYFALDTDCEYNYDKDSFNVEANIKNATLAGKDVKISKIILAKTPQNIAILPGNFEIGSLRGHFGGDANSSNSFFIKANGVELASKGNPKEKAVMKASIDFDKASPWLYELFDIKRNSLSGSLDLKAGVSWSSDGHKVDLQANSPQMTAYNFDVKNLQMLASYNNDTITFNSLQFKNRDQIYKITKTATVAIDNNNIALSDLVVNDTLFAKAMYKNGELHSDFELKNYFFYDSKLAKMYLNGSGWLVRKDGKNYINGDIFARDIEFYYYPKGAKITKDRDIKVINKKALPLAEEEFIKNTQISIRIAHKGTVAYKTKDVNAELLADLIYYKDFMKKPNFVGLVRVLNGSYNFEGRKFKLLNGDIVLLNGENDNPYIDLKLKLEESDITIFVGAKGFASAPKLTFWSTPALGEREIMSYLIFGIDDEFGFDKAQVKSDYTAKAIGALSNSLSRDVVNELGLKLDKIEVSPSDYIREGKVATGGAKVEVGKRVTKDLTVTYKNDVESGMALQYRINRNIGIETETRSRGNSVDLFFKKDY